MTIQRQPIPVPRSRFAPVVPPITTSPDAAASPHLAPSSSSPSTDPKPHHRIESPATMTKPNTFTDATGRRWSITISLATIRAVKSAHDLDLTRFAIDSTVLTAFEDPCRFSEILSTILAHDLNRERLTQDDLEASLSGDAINDAIFATVRAIRDFLPEAPRQIASKVVDRMEHAARNQIDLAGKAVRSGALDVAYDAAIRKVEEEFDRMLATQETASPAPQ